MPEKSKKITIQVDEEALQILRDEVRCMETLVTYAKEIDHKENLGKLIAEVKVFLKTAES